MADRSDSDFESSASETRQGSERAVPQARLITQTEAPLHEDEDASQQLLAHHPLVAAVKSGNLISQEEMKEIKAAIETQDKIVLALEQDNKRLHTEHRAMAAKLKHVERTNSRLEAKVVLQSTAAGGVVVTSSTDRSPQSGSVNEGALQQQVELLNLKLRELHEQNDELRVKEGELRVEFDALKKEKRDLERKFDPQQVTQAEIEAREARVEMQRAKNQYNEELDDMLRKVAWYVDHQETNRAQEDLIKNQQQTINDLRLRVVELEGYQKVGPGAPPTEKDKRIRQLEKRIVEMESNLREQNPNSIPELIRACRPSPDESKRNKVLLTKIHNLEAELEEQQTQSSRTLDRLRVESDGLRAQYQQRMEKLEDDMKAKLLNAQSRKVKEIEKQLNDTKRYYTGKVKDLEQINLALRRAPNTSTSGAANSIKSRAKPTNQAKVDPEKEASEREQSASPAPEDVASPAPVSTSGTPSVQLAAFQQLHMQQQMELMRVLRERDEMALRLREVEQKVRRVEEHEVFTKTELEACRRERDELMQTANQLRQSAGIFENRIEQVNGDHRRGLEGMRQQFLSEIARQEEEHKKEIQMMKDTQRAFDFVAPPTTSSKEFILGEVDSGRNSPNEVRKYLRLVAERLGQIEQQQVARDLDQKRKVEEIRKMAEHEVQVERQKMELILQEKNNEIHHFRLQLDNLLADIALLHRQGQMSEFTNTSKSPA